MIPKGAVVPKGMTNPYAMADQRPPLIGARRLAAGSLDFGRADLEDVTVSQTAELSRVKARIKALTEKTIANGCTEAEAMAAAEMVGRLLERYALSMDAIEIRTARCSQVTVPLGGRRRRPIDGCVPAIARFCDCKVWLARAAAPDPMQQEAAAAAIGRHYVFFGFETDTALATYLFAVIERAVSTETATFRQLNPRLRRASASFQHGVVVRVSERLDACTTLGRRPCVPSAQPARI